MVALLRSYKAHVYNKIAIHNHGNVIGHPFLNCFWFSVGTS